MSKKSGGKKRVAALWHRNKYPRDWREDYQSGLRSAMERSGNKFRRKHKR